MKKYLILVLTSVIAITVCIYFPKIESSFAQNCATVPIIKATASKKITCKGIIKKDNEYFAEIQITEDDISLVTLGQEVDVHCNALGDEVLKGEISELSDKAYQTNYAGMNYTVIDARVKLIDKSDKLKTGYSVTAEVILNEINNADILPFEAVAQEKDGQYYIYRIIDGWAVKEYIDVIFEDEKGVVVSGERDYENICEAPESFTEDRVRVNTNGND